MTYSPEAMKPGATVRVSVRNRNGDWHPTTNGKITTLVPGSNFFILEQGSMLTKFTLSSGLSQVDVPLMQVVGLAE